MCLSINRCTLPLPLPFRPLGINPRTSRHQPPLRLQASTGGLPSRSTIPQASTEGYPFSPSRCYLEDFPTFPRHQLGDTPLRLKSSTGGFPFQPTVSQASTGGYYVPPPGINRRITDQLSAARH
ncbi:hypothetical protein Zmor_008397 [Zophobas morio]|uniref:Uncharacterized protein n=1 Tax=Zophobas morio TaxID=2755281 RepID=A0AA38IY28_9CUCU|nr:hypothetical protein Zmor_008397 [Zophobas morio]